MIDKVAMNGSHDKLIYIYCITRKVPLLVNPEILKRLCFVETYGLYAAVKYVSEDEYSEENIKKNISDVAWLDRNVREHLATISAIMQMETVIPFNFGTIYKSEGSLKLFVSRYVNDFMERFRHLEDKEEWSVKVFCDRKKIIENIGVLSQNISDIDLQIKNSSPGKAYILGKKKKEIIETEIKSIYNTISKRIFTALNELCEEYQFNVILSSELSEKDEDMILNVAFFIKKTNVDHFIENSDRLQHENVNVGMIVDITGPWPSYTFLNLSH